MNSERDYNFASKRIMGLTMILNSPCPIVFKEVTDND